MMVIRFGYCPPNPGPNAKIRNEWYTNIKDAINEYNGRDKIYISVNKSGYREIDFDKLCELNNEYN